MDLEEAVQDLLYYIAVDLWRKPFVDQEEAVDLEDAVDHRREQRMASCTTSTAH